MEQELIDFITSGITQGASPEELMQGVMQKFNLAQEEAAEYISVVAEELQKAQQGSKGKPAEGKSQEQGDSSPEKVLNILEQVQMPPEAAAALIKAILDLNEEGLKALLDVLDQALSQGGQQQGPPPPAEGMSADPMENI